MNIRKRLRRNQTIAPNKNGTNRLPLRTRRSLRKETGLLSTTTPSGDKFEPQVDQNSPAYVPNDNLPTEAKERKAKPLQSQIEKVEKAIKSCKLAGSRKTDSRMKIVAALVYLHLNNLRNGYQVSVISEKMLAKRTKLNERTIRKHIKALKEAEIVYTLDENTGEIREAKGGKRTVPIKDGYKKEGIAACREVEWSKLLKMLKGNGMGEKQTNNLLVNLNFVLRACERTIVTLPSAPHNGALKLSQQPSSEEVLVRRLYHQELLSVQAIRHHKDKWVDIEYEKKFGISRREDGALPMNDDLDWGLGELTSPLKASLETPHRPVNSLTLKAVA